MATNEQQVLFQLQDEMVKKAEQLVQDLNLKREEGSEKGKTQASKALEVAQSAGSLSVFINWIRYQAGREKSADFWTKRAGDRPTLARAVVDELNWIGNQVGALLETNDAQIKARVTMRAATRFLGYFRRALIGADYLEEIRLEEV